MKKEFTFYSFIILFLLFNSFSRGQITIVLQDYKNQYVFGNKLYTYTDKTTSTINLGSPNSSSWDFSNLKMDDSYVCDVISPNTTPFKPDYPSSDVAYEIITGGEHNWEFYCHYSSVHLHGLVFTSSSQPGLVNKTIYTPVKITAHLPMTYYTSWKDSVKEIVKVEQNNVVTSTTESIIVTSALADAYGPLTLPGGKTVDALRVKIEQTKMAGANSEKTITYKWYTKTGESIAFVTNASANHGMADVIGDIKFVVTSPVTNVEDEVQKPEKFELLQNFPNPFNPSTTIKYAVAEDSEVEIKVFSTIGKEVASLVSERKPAGVYTTSFDGTGLTSGVYFVKMSAGNFNQVLKMTLLK